MRSVSATLIVALSYFLLCSLQGSATATEKQEVNKAESPKSPKSLVRKLDVKAPAGSQPGKSFDKPRQVFKAADLPKGLPEEVVKGIDFGSEQVVIFSWGGSGGDRLFVELSKDKDKPIATFKLRRGATDDFVHHYQMYVLKKEVAIRFAE